MVGAAFGAAGQRCMALTTAVFVGEARKWIPDVVEKAKKLKVSAGESNSFLFSHSVYQFLLTLCFKSGHEPNTDIGPVISKESKKRIEKIIEKSIKEGAKVLLDGRDVKVDKYPNGNFVGPTVIADAKVCV